MASTQAHAQRFFLNEDLWLEDCVCSLNDLSLHLAKGEKSFNLALDNIAFTGFRKGTDEKPAAVVLCQAGSSGDMGSEEEADRPADPFDDLVVEFASEEDALKFHKLIEQAVSKVSAQNETNAPSSSSSEEEDDDEDLPSKMLREAQNPESENPTVDNFAG